MCLTSFRNRLNSWRTITSTSLRERRARVADLRGSALLSVRKITPGTRGQHPLASLCPMTRCSDERCLQVYRDGVCVADNYNGNGGKILTVEMTTERRGLLLVETGPGKLHAQCRPPLVHYPNKARGLTSV